MDPQDALLRNLQGHAVVVVYGLELERLAPWSVASLGQLLTLQATQEVIYMPIASRQPLEEFLDAATQLSRGRLRRQASDDIVQYAWFEDDELSWALMLHKDYLLFVDSPSTFSHALGHTKGPRPLPKKMAATFGPLLAPSPRRSGLFLDLEVLATMAPGQRRCAAG